MSRDQIKQKFSGINRTTLILIALAIGGGSGSGLTAMRGPDNSKFESIEGDIQDLKIQTARMEQKLDDFIEHSRDRKLSASK